MSHFIAIIEKISVEKLARVFRNNAWKLYRSLEDVISDRGPQFAMGLMKEMKKMLEVKTKLLIVFHPQTKRKMEITNQKLEKYLRMYQS